MRDRSMRKPTTTTYRVTDLSIGFFKPDICSRVRSLSLIFFLFFFIKQPSRSVTLTRCHLNGCQDIVCVYSMPLFCHTSFFLSLRCKIKQSLCSVERDPAVFTGKIVGKIRDGRGEGTNKKFAMLLTHLSSTVPSNPLFIDKCYMISP